MKYLLILLFVFLVASCATEDSVVEDVPSEQESEGSDTLSEEDLANYDDDLDAALQELDIVG